MRFLKSLFVLSVVTIFAFSCKEDPKPVTPEAPVIENATLRGINGETTIVVGNKVVFTADVSVQGSELNSFSLEVKKGAEIVGSASGELAGQSARIEHEFDLPISAATLDAPFYPQVTVKVTNTDEMYTERTLSEDESVYITTPELFDALYLVDNKGKVWQMSPTSTKGKYRTDGDLAEIGSSITIASKLTSDNKVDQSGSVWTYDTPDSGGYGLIWIGFDAFNEELSKMINNTITLDMNKMAKDGEHYVYWNNPFVQDSRVVFLNYPDGMLLQSDRFDDIDKNTARYTGHTGDHFEVYYIVDTKWLIVKEQYIATDCLWCTGQNASLPMSPYCEGHPLNWFASGVDVSYATASCVKLGNSKFTVLLYLKENFAIKLYDGWSWGNELQWESATPETLVISDMETDPETGKTDGNYGNAGASFTEGAYVLTYDKTTRKASLVRYGGVLLAGMETGNAEPDPQPVPDPDPVTETVSLDLNGMADNTDFGTGLKVRWVLELTQNCTVKFENFDAKISEMVNAAIFDNIDEDAKTARYIGATEKYEVWYRTEQKWLIFTNNIASENVLLIGKKASFPQSPYTEYPIIETDIPRTPGQTLPLNKVSDGIFRSYIYLADDFAFYVYTGYAWANMVTGWTSGSPDLLVAQTGSYGTQNVNNAFAPGVYLVEYDKTANKVTLSK